MHIAYQNVQMEEDNHVTCKMETIKEKAGKKYVQMGKESWGITEEMSSILISSCPVHLLESDFSI